MDKFKVAVAALVIGSLVCGCRSLKEMEDVEEPGYSYSFTGDNERLEFYMPEKDAAIEPFSLMLMIDKALDPLTTGLAGAGGTEGRWVHNKEALVQAKRVMEILDERARKARPEESFAKFIKQYSDWDWPSEEAKEDMMLQTLRKAAAAEKEKQPELHAILLLILGNLYEGKYDEESEDTGCLNSALGIYNNLAMNETAPEVYRATALYREGRLLFKLKKDADAVAKTEKLLKEYQAYSDWRFYELANWTRTEHPEIQGGIDTVEVLLEMCRKGYSGAVLTALGCLSEKRYSPLEAQYQFPFSAISLWAQSETKKKGVSEEVFELAKEMNAARGGDRYPTAGVRRMWLWWLRERKNFPRQKLPVDMENMKESELLREFVHEIRKDSALASKHRDLLNQALKDADRLERQKKRDK